MNILIILPGLSINYNSIGFTILGLEKFGYCPVIITSRSRGLKDPGMNSDYEEHGNTKIYRIVDKSLDIWKAKGTKTESLISDIIVRHDVKMMFASTNGCFEISSYLSKKHSLPNVMMLEYIFHKERFFGYSKKRYLGINILIPFAWKYYYNKYLKHHSALLTFYNEEEKKSLKTSNTFFVPWCNQIPEGIQITNKKNNSIIFAGELTKLTIKDEFLTELANILNENIVEEIHFVGYGNKLYKIEELKKVFADRIIIHGSLPRNKVLELIGKAKYGIQPATLGGWGFMGECLALKTPLITLKSNKYRLQNKKNIIMVDRFDNISKELLIYNKNCVLYKQIQDNGFDFYTNNHTGKVTAKYLSDIIKKILDEKN